MITRSAITQYVTYMAEYQRWSERHSGQSGFFVPPCPEMRQLLIAEFGYDPTRRPDEEPPPSPAMPSREPVGAGPTAAQAAPDGDHGDPREDPPNDRLSDLLDAQNRFV